ncbi:TonB-dependent receptor [Chryseobacterium indologenes]|uniref:TonB-dependent receptor plug domain-containing protein n=1 Tax=Chryseobacterium indologenes TaxID=253 RepID=UPI000F4D5C57|nr:TonB-dependent receptor [Chryseobacterium indologenes]AYZ36564.1 TonB-dependent receptor [Chryseobacterium indologenes]MBF6645252.1 TonB-dependent receptor plug domain-containing protein [Chryseobacterium indologenes]MBU3048688.1 TonB-dependent receptor plug domain-containing protein [Chryseobacterium indologenes]MEB4762057.1 TonB-dependent receptor plug domain-containing protein [Chryseobacterium indologenes]QQQ71077.1 TonB-dependent receptor plug domain-containing protein [Chryseobacteriu
MKKKVLSILSLSSIFLVNAQQQDSLKHKKIEEVVVTGQYTQQSINKSIYKVEVINAEQIKNMAATSVADVLNQSLNVLIISDRRSGNSTANLMGLGGEYTKVLIDNIPVVGDIGLGNNIDLTKLNINNVERIEVVRGSMGVDYGSNAVAGVINIITRKNSQKALTLNASVQEETVGKEYDFKKKGEGRHIQTLNIGYNINENWYVGANINRNDFQGFKGTQEGYKYFEQDGKRGYLWQPKDVLNVDGVLRYSKNKTSIFYKFGFVNEKLNYYNPTVGEHFYSVTDRTYFSNDRDYQTTRYLHQLNVQTKLGAVNYTGDFSYQTQDRKYRDFKYDIPNRKVIGNKDDYQSYNKADVFYSRGVFSNFLDSKKIDFQLGYELDHTSGYAGNIAGTFKGTDNVKRKIFNYANFMSIEWNATDWLSLRPGYRLALSDKFDAQHNYSLTARVKATENDNLRLVVGSANRFPNFDELYTYMVDSNHDIRGNEDLTPEKGMTVSVNGEKRISTDSGWNLGLGASATYLHVKDRIESVTVSRQPLKYQYLNLNKYESFLFEANFKAQKKQLALAANVAYYGISKKLKDGDAVSPNDFFFTLEANAVVNYTIPNVNTTLSLFYKYTGKTQEFVLSGDLKKPEYRIGERDDFHMMNFIVTQPFFNNHLELSLGIKNIFDVSSIRDTTLPGNAHEAADPKINLFYGRSYLARLSYNF